MPLSDGNTLRVSIPGCKSRGKEKPWEEIAVSKKRAEFVLLARQGGREQDAPVPLGWRPATTERPPTETPQTLKPPSWRGERDNPHIHGDKHGNEETRFLSQPSHSREGQ
jgi:hypothetical protein